MGLKFYFGASGSGKSKKLHTDIIEQSLLNPKTNYLIIVPDQFTMQTQMDIVAAHPNKGIMNIDVLSFGRLSHRILEEVGTEKRVVLDDTGKSLILRKVAETITDKMPVIGSNLNKLGYIHEVKSAISEFMQYGIGEKELAKLTEYAIKRGALYYKLKDLSVLHKEFLNYIRDKYITTEETLDLVRMLLPESKLIQNSVIAFDGFTGFTPVQNNLIQKLFVLSKEVIITGVIGEGEDPYLLDGEQNLYYLTKKTVFDLTKLVKEVNVKREEDIFLRERPLPRFKNNDEMNHLEENLFRFPVKSYEQATTAIHLFEASTPGEEVRQVCMKIKELVREKHYSYRDFSIVAGDLESYVGHLKMEAAKFDIPIFMDRTRGILLNPFTEYIRSALKIIMDNFSEESIFHYLRSGLTGFDREDTDRLENYIRARGIKGKKKWTTLFTISEDGGNGETSAKEWEKLNQMRELLIAQLAPLMEKTQTAGEKVTALYDFITENRVQEKLVAYEKWFQEKKELERAKEYGQIYRLVMDLLDQIYSLLAEEKMGMKEFADILDAGFGEITVGTIPQNVDRVVAGDIERTRLKEIKVLFFIGINDGIIPKSTGTGGIISDIDREFLSESPYTLAPSPRLKMYTQRLYLYMNMTKPSELLYLSYCKVNGEGKSMRPAYLINTMNQLFPAMQTEKPELRPDEEQIETKQSGLDCFTGMLRRYASGEVEDSKRRKLVSFYHVYNEDDEYREITKQLLDAAFMRYQATPLGKKIAEELYGKILVSSVSRLEKYAACAYAHFLQYGLSLKEREEYGFEAVDMGNVFHGVLELFASGLEEQGRTWFDFEEKEADDILKKALDAYSVSYGETVLYSNARNEYVIKRMNRILKRAVMTLQYQLKKGSFTPENFEMSFGIAQDLESVNIALTEDEKIRLRGRIDRIDTFEDENHVYVKVIDYKSGNKKFDLAALYYGLQLQLVVYMNAALEMEKRKYPDKEAVPAALLYYHIDDPIVKADGEVTPEEINKQLLKELRMTGIVNLNDDIVGLLDKTLEEKSDVVPVERKKDGSFSAKSSVMKQEDLLEISNYVNLKIKQSGKAVLDGDIAVSPYEQGNLTACDYCSYRPVCGFEAGMEGYAYRTLETMDEETAMTKIREANS